jgi:WD40 repeat protein
VESLAFSADGRLLASGARDGKVRIHAAGGRLIRTHQRLRERVLAVAWSDPDRGFFAGLADGSVHRLAPDGDGSTPVLPPGGPAVHALLALQGGVLLAGTRAGIVEVVPR